MKLTKIGLFGSCQLNICDFFLNEHVKNTNNFKIIFSLPFYEYDSMSPYYREEVNYAIFDELDILIIENNKLNNSASSKKIIDYCEKKLNIKIIKTFLVKFPIYPINWSGYGENKQDYIDWVDIDKIDFKSKFEKCMLSLIENNKHSDLSLEISNFIKDNFNKQLLFTHSLHPTNILLFEIWKQILYHLNVTIDSNNYDFNGELIQCWYNPFTTKMMSDLNIEFTTIIDDDFYINKYNENKKLILNH
jgi:hypothetical protein